METLQQAIEKVVETIPMLFFERLISKKLKAQGITGSKTLSKRIAQHILSRSNEPFAYRSRKHSGRISLSIDKAETDEMVRAIESFCETQLPKIVPEAAHRGSKIVLQRLRTTWPDEHAAQNTELAGFRNRLEDRWGEPLGELRMLLTMAREWGEGAHNVELARGNKRTRLQEILIRLLVRGCQVTDEIVCLLENGFADGAMARWRTLHEITVVAAVISRHGEDMAERYFAHQAVESKRAMDKYQTCYKQLGFKPLSPHVQQKIVKAFDKAVARYGKPFKTDYGWAASHLKNDRPTFAHLEEAAGRSDMRSYYQMGNDNIHAGIKSMFFRLGLLGDDMGLLTGRSIAGLMEPGQNTAYTFTRLCALVCLRSSNFDDLVVGGMMSTLQHEIPKSFYRAEKQLRKDHKKYVATRNSNTAGVNPPD